MDCTFCRSALICTSFKFMLDLWAKKSLQSVKYIKRKKYQNHIIFHDDFNEHSVDTFHSYIYFSAYRYLCSFCQFKGIFIDFHIGMYTIGLYRSPYGVKRTKKRKRKKMNDGIENMKLLYIFFLFLPIS